MAVSTMVRGLERALARAALADDRELAAKVREEGRRFVFLLNGVMRISRLYDPENTAFDTPCQETAVVLQKLLELLGTIHIICVEDQIYLNDIRLRIGPTEQAMAEGFIMELARHKIGGISIHGEINAEEIKSLGMTMSRPSADPLHPRDALRAQLTSLDRIDMTGTYRFTVGGETEGRKKDVIDTMVRCEGVIQEAMHNLAAERIPNPLPVRRAVIELLDALREDASEGLAAPMKRHGGSASIQHLISVSSLAMLLGQMIGLPEAAMNDLGMAAMLHDIGSVHRPDWSGHAAAGARILMRQRGFHEAKIRRLLLVLEHHVPYRKVAESEDEEPVETPSLFARILHIVDDYDILTAFQPGTAPMMSPARAVGSMWSARGTAYDPDLLSLFVQLMGRYPPGSLIELSDGRWAVSVSGGRDRAHFEKPIIRIVRDTNGAACDATEVIDLFQEYASVQPRLLIDQTGANDQMISSLVDGALRNPLQPDTKMFI